MGLFAKLVGMTRKPEGLLGRLMLRSMNVGHSRLADWGMTQLPRISPAGILDIGCGGGRNAGALLKRYPEAHVTAIDYSPLSVERSTAYNQAAIEQGRCTVRQGDASNLDFPPERFELVTAFETVYFWPGIERCFQQVAGVLKPDGAFLIVNESDGTDATGLKYEKIIDGMRCYTAEQLTQALKGAGFGRVRVVHADNRPWMAVIAEK